MQHQNVRFFQCNERDADGSGGSLRRQLGIKTNTNLRTTSNQADISTVYEVGVDIQPLNMTFYRKNSNYTSIPHTDFY